MGVVEVVVIDRDRLNQEVVSGKWREWLWMRMARERLGDVPSDFLSQHPIPEDYPNYEMSDTPIPGVKMLHTGWGTSRMAEGVLRGPFYQRSGIDCGAFAIVFHHREDFGGRLLRLTGTQRVAIEAATRSDWTVYERVFDSMSGPSGPTFSDLLAEGEMARNRVRESMKNIYRTQRKGR